MSRILITGVSGFIGSHLARQLRGGHDVTGLIRHSASRDMAGLTPFLRGVRLVTGDICDLAGMQGLLRQTDPDIVVHLAAMSPVRHSFDMPFAYVQTNVTGTLNLAHAMLTLARPRRRKFIYASTAEVYGIQADSPIREDAPLLPSSPYAGTKAMTDGYARMMTSVYGLNTTVLRCVNSYGRKLDASFMVEYLITSMLKGGTVYVGAPDSLRDYMYVDDHVRAYLAAIRHPETAGEAFNAAAGFVVSNRDLALKIAGILGFPRRKLVFGRYPPGYPSRPLASDQPFIELDASKIRSMLGWRPRVSLDEGLRRSIDHWRSR